MKRLIYIALALATMLASCKDDYLATTPSTAVGEAELTASPDLFENYVNGIHTYIYSANYDHQSRGVASMDAFLDLLGDDMVNTVTGYFTNYYRYSDSRSPSGFLPKVYWDYYYTVVERTNRAIALAEKVEGASKEQISTWLAEAHTIRAWAYHRLVQLFGKRFVKGEANDNPGVLLRLEVGFDHMPRSTVAEVYAQINDDIQKAFAYSAAGFDLGKKNRIRPSTTYGVAARIALTQEEWAQAAIYADSAIAKSGATLQRGKELLNGFNNMEATEWMWGYTQNAAQNFYWASFYANNAYNVAGYNYFSNFAINRSILDKCGPNDIRWKWFICVDKGDEIPADISLSAYNTHFGSRGVLDGLPGWEITGYQIKYYAADSLVTFGDQLAMRLGEMYYIKAEALARAGDEAGAKDALVTVMETRDPDYTAATVASLTGDDLIEEIMRNRRVDLYKEGHRFFDLKRLRQLPQRLPSNDLTYLAMGQAKLALNAALVDSINARFALMTKEDSAVAKKFQADTAANILYNTRCIARAKRFIAREASYMLPQSLDDNRWEFVIPIGEIQGNPLCTQNPM